MWNTQLTTLTRSLVGDFGTSQTFDDARIQTAVLTAGILVTQEYEMGQVYTFNLDNMTMTPDPTDPARPDPVFVALVILKATCILNMNAYQGAVGTGISVRDGDSAVDTTGSFKGYADILKLGACASYERLLKSLYFSNVRGKAVMTPVARYSLGSAGVWSIRSLYNSFGIGPGGFGY